MVKKAEIPRHIVDSALALAAERPWREISLAEIAEAAKLPLSKVYPLYPSKQAILSAFFRFIDSEVLADASLAEDWQAGETSARDRLFDVLMRRFDALQPYRLALANLAYDQARDPLAVVCGLCCLRRSMAAMLEAAGLSSSGGKGALRWKGLSAIYLGTLRTWLKDESADMAPTMASLDGYLRRTEAFLQRLPRRSSRPA